MKGDRVRSLYFTDEFRDFYDSLSLKVRNKFDYVLTMIASEKIVSTKFVKHLVSYDLYEMRVSVGNNEYRTILFAVDNDNFILSTKVILLNGFMKKSNKDYVKQIEIAQNILRRINDDTYR